MKKQKIIIIGAGFASLSAASYLAKSGYDVTILEKNETVGGRARQYKKDGFTFDIGPTFYWMPDVFENYFKDFDKNLKDYYSLKRLDPAYEVFFDDKTSLKIGGSYDEIKNTFKSIETNGDQKLDAFISNAESNYKIAIQDLVYNPGESLLEIVSLKTFLKLKLFFQSIKGQVRSKFKNEKLRKILEFPVLFLGAKPSTTPAFYNFMNYADLKLGTWHPEGGMYEVVKSMEKLNNELNVEIITNCSVEKINIEGKTVKSVNTIKGEFKCDILLSGADYAFTETLLPMRLRQYSENYWNSKTFAPSALLFFVGFNKKIDNVSHHSLFFDTDFEEHASTIYDSKTWPEKPLFYASFPSITDKTAAPKAYEAGIFLIPIAPGLEDTETKREKCFKIIMERLESFTDQNLQDAVLFKKSYSVNDFISDYNSYKGNAYGLANTLTQTHILRPKLKTKKLTNLYFTGQLTVPGPGVPPSLISGKVVSELIQKYHS
ncbi:phytoene desaturase family protein [Urechidicola vernalis]|uniref:Phytoene desaturase family protein n=1 Tax=Urechidicola vernalis TaxID=3075600 RepID=A0ABU2Y2L1_9FLAO|nr:phytoene desaturase family protein [Urechidicola sp. P050]MDT0552395.1 phytoene desaturase family protein [Urechidicola sp. P050]